MKYSILKTTTVAVFSAVLAVSAHANLLINGSFEDNNVNAGSWQAFNSADVDGWDGSRIELWNNYGGVQAYDGVNFAELNADPNQAQGFFSIFQDFQTVTGQTYDFSFAYRARRDNFGESFNFYIGDSTDFTMGQSTTLNDHTTAGWSVFQGSFTALTAESRVMFTSNNLGTYGNFLDDVVVLPVPEPATLGLLGLGVLGLVGARRRKS